MGLSLKQAIDAILGRKISGYTLIEKYTPNKDQRVTFHQKDKTLIVAFYGTMNTLSDWINNLKIGPKDFRTNKRTYEGCTGFVDEAKSLMSKVRDMIVILSPNEIVVVGHSQGGTHATLAFAELMDNLSVPLQGITFEAPMVFTKSSANLFENVLKQRSDCTFNRYLVPGDPVPGLPGGGFGLAQATPTRKIENTVRLFPDFKYHQLSYIETKV